MAMAANSTSLPRGMKLGSAERSIVAKKRVIHPVRAVASPDKPKRSEVSIQVDKPFRKPSSKTGIPAVWPSVEEMTSEATLKAIQQESGRMDRAGLDESYKHLLKTAYEKCGNVTEIYAKTFHLGTMLMTPERQRAIWAIYLWCRRTDELVDGPNSTHITPTALDRWEERLNQIFEGRPYDLLDSALSDTVSTFPLGIQPFIDMIEGMRMDLHKSRYETFEELYLYCYRVAGTVGLMSTPVMGIAKDSFLSTEKVYEAALALGIANQLTNILRDVGEDRERGRIYVPTQELEKFGYSEEDLMNGVLDERWRSFMKFQIARARMYFDKAEQGVFCLAPESRFPVYASLVIYRSILNKIEENGYDNFTKRAYVPKWEKLAYLPLCFARASLPTSLLMKKAN